MGQWGLNLTPLYSSAWSNASFPYPGQVKLLLWNSQNSEHQKYIWNVILLRGESQQSMRKLNCNSHSNKFVVFRFAHLSCTLLWLVTQSTVWKFFRCSQFTEFDSNTLIEINLHLITLYFHLLHLLLKVPSTDWKWERNIQKTFNIQTNIACTYVQVCRQLQNLLKLENSMNQGRAALEELERAPTNSMIFVILHFFGNYCEKLDHFWDFSQVHKKSQICSCV